MGLLPDRILVHTALPLVYAEAQTVPPEWIEGEPGEQGGGASVELAAFACFLFLPGPGGEQQNPYRPRTVREPTLLYNPERADGTPILPADELLITAPELAAVTGAETARYLTVGDPQPFGPPGRVGGYQATLRLVRD